MELLVALTVKVISKMEVTKIKELAYQLKVRDAMTKDVISTHPDTKIKDLLDLFLKNRILGSPVVDGDQLIGVVNLEDLIKCLADGEVNADVKDKMVKEIRVLYSDEPLILAVNKFQQFGFDRFPVIDRDSKKLVGIITKGDIIRATLKALEIDYHKLEVEYRRKKEIKSFRVNHLLEDMESDGTTLVFKYKVAGSDFRNAGESSSKLKKNLLKLGIDGELIRRVAIATYEAEMNIVIYTNGGEIIANIEPGRIRIEAIDNGPGIPDIEKALQPGFSTAPSWVRELGFGAGMGLPNIKKCSDELNIESKVNEGTKVQFVVNLS